LSRKFKGHIEPISKRIVIPAKAGMTSETWEYISHCHVWGKHSELQEANMSLGLSALGTTLASTQILGST
jgi:hypothetical protein